MKVTLRITRLGMTTAGLRDVLIMQPLLHTTVQLAREMPRVLHLLPTPALCGLCR